MIQPLKKHPWRAAYAAILSGMLLFAAFSAFRLGQADLMAVRAENTLNAVKRGDRQSPEDLQEAVRWAQAALSIHRHYAPYHEILGNIYLARQLDSSPDAPLAPDENPARDQFRALLRNRPTWAFGWGDLILAKIDQLEFDEELTRALEQVATRYPFMPQVQVLAATSALSAWPLLEETVRNTLMRSLRYAYSLQPDTLRDAADSYAEMGVLCPLLDSASRAQYCP